MAKDDNPFFNLANIDYSAGPPRESMYSGFVPGTNPMAGKAAKQRQMREAQGLTPLGAILRGTGEGYFGDVGNPMAERGHSVMDPSRQAPAGREAEMQRYQDIGTVLGIVADPATMLAPLAKPAAKAVGRGAIKIATSPQMQAKLERVAELTGAAPMYAKPEGNLNFQPIIRASSLKGPDKQPLQSFIQQMKSQKGVTKAGTEYGLDVLKAYDPTTKITKQEFEDLLTPSRYSKVDLAGASDDTNMHLWNQAGNDIRNVKNGLQGHRI